MMRRKKTHSLSYFRGEKKHSRKKRFDPYLPLYLKAIVRRRGRFLKKKEGVRERQKTMSFIFWPPPNKSASLPSKIRKKRRKMALFLKREKQRDFPPILFFLGQNLPHCSKILTTQNVLIHNNAITDANDEKIEGANRRHRQGGRQG